MTQIALPLDISVSDEDRGYLVSESNAAIHAHLQNWKSWPILTTIIVGEKSSGKSAMARTFEKEAGGLILDDADKEYDETIFHIWNRAQNEKLPLLLTATKQVSEWDVELPDLQSRLAASQLIEIGVPDDFMVEGLLQQYFARRGLSISQDALGFVSKRVERSYHYVELLARKMDKIAFERKKPVTLAVARAALEDC